ncbi:MAG: hypothetical protein V3V08_21815 [Nannocystaceae bacterium]
MSLADFVGRYRFVGGAKQRNQVTAAIDRSAASVSFLFRGIARSKLSDASEVPDPVEIRVRDGELTIRRGLQIMRGSVGRATQGYNAREGEQVTVSYRRTGNRLIEVADSKRGERRTVYVLDQAKGTLQLRISLTSPHMEIPLRYTLSYRRL